MTPFEYCEFDFRDLERVKFRNIPENIFRIRDIDEKIGFGFIIREGWLFPYPEDYPVEWWYRICRNAKHFSELYVFGEEMTKSQVENNPWHNFFPWPKVAVSWTRKFILDNGYVVFASRQFRKHYSEQHDKPIVYNRMFLEVNDSPEAAARRIASAFNFINSVAVPIRLLSKVVEASERGTKEVEFDLMKGRLLD